VVKAKRLLAGVRAVVFDAVGTLITPDPPAAAVYAGVGRLYGSRLDVAVVGDRFRAAFRREEERDRTAGWRTDAAREERRWRSIVGEVLDDVTDPEACFRELWEHFARPAAWACLPGAEAVVAELARRGYAVGIASNFDGRLRSVVAGLSGLAAVRPLVISAEVGWRKPARTFFDAVAWSAGCEPGAVLLVGDDLENDYEGATAAGLRAVLLDPNGQAEPGVVTVAGLEQLLTGGRDRP
jgi:putative hydrolase of the HAD superfamily